MRRLSKVERQRGIHTSLGLNHVPNEAPCVCVGGCVQREAGVDFPSVTDERADSD